MKRGRDVGPNRSPGRALSVMCLALLLAGTAAAGASISGNMSNNPQRYCSFVRVRNYERPLLALPAVRRLPGASERGSLRKLPFGPPGLRLTQQGDLTGERLDLGGGPFGYRLTVKSIGHRIRLDWLVLARLFSVASNESRHLQTSRRRVSEVGYGRQGDTIIVDLPKRPAIYRLDLTFKNAGGRVLGRFSEYVRVVEALAEARIGTQRKRYQAGDTLRGRVENLGTEAVLFPPSFLVEKFVDGNWVRVGPARTIWPRSLSALKAGWASNCMIYHIPSHFTPGLYRLKKWLSYLGEEEFDATAEFYVRPVAAGSSD
jgi:hypothetical protein